ncbi:DgyrCDS5220 [Dimorphilus gyrociliatus]|uniref:DgyrCDS5220 n=1 Tax=Dimorphilus gyrociliatus TaxID=2664684 RepID=A0A7I8VJ80_9ANNE|nr:DgyrCDS5220 [Dimorphilus gyrociliatus]
MLKVKLEKVKKANSKWCKLLKTDDASNICSSEYCVKLAGSMLKLMNLNENPCTNFNYFSCGLSPFNGDSVNNVHVYNALKLALIEQELSENTTIFKQQQRFFHSCLKYFRKNESNHLKVLLDEIGVKYLTSEKWDTLNLKEVFRETLIKLHQLKIFVFFKLKLTKDRIEVYKDYLTLSNSFNEDNSIPLRNIASHFFYSLYPSLNSEHRSKIINSIFNIEKELLKFSKSNDKETEEPLRLDDIANKFNGLIDFQRLINNISPEIYEYIVFKDFYKIDKLIELIEKTPFEDLHNYLIFRASFELRHIIDFQRSFKAKYQTRCLHLTDQYFPYLFKYLFYKDTEQTTIKLDRDTINDIFNKIRGEVENVLGARVERFRYINVEIDFETVNLIERPFKKNLTFIQMIIHLREQRSFDMSYTNSSLQENDILLDDYEKKALLISPEAIAHFSPLNKLPVSLRYGYLGTLLAHHLIQSVLRENDSLFPEEKQCVVGQFKFNDNYNKNFIREALAFRLALRISQTVYEREMEENGSMNEERVIPDDPDAEIAKLRAVYQKLVDKNQELRKREFQEEDRLNGTSLSDTENVLKNEIDVPPSMIKIDNFLDRDPERIDDGFIDSHNHSPNKERSNLEVSNSNNTISKQKKLVTEALSQREGSNFCYFCYLSEWEQPSGYQHEIQEDDMDAEIVDWLEDALDETYGYNSDDDPMGISMDVRSYLKKLRQSCSLPSDFLKQCLVGGDEVENAGKKKSKKAAVAALTKDVTKKGAKQYSEMQELARQQEEYLRKSLTSSELRQSMTFKSPGGTVLSPGSERYQEMQDKFREQEEYYILNSSGSTPNRSSNLNLEDCNDEDSYTKEYIDESNNMSIIPNGSRGHRNSEDLSRKNEKHVKQSLTDFEIREKVRVKPPSPPSTGESLSPPPSDYTTSDIPTNKPKLSVKPRTRKGTYGIPVKPSSIPSVENLSDESQQDHSNSQDSLNSNSSSNRSLERDKHRSSLPNLKQSAQPSRLGAIRPRGIPKPSSASSLSKIPSGNASRLARPSKYGYVNSSKQTNDDTWNDGCY